VFSLEVILSDLNMLRNGIALLLLPALLSACSSIKDSPKYQLNDGIYDFRQLPDAYKKAYVYVTDDTVRIFLKEKPKESVMPDRLRDQFFLKRSFDVDVMTIPFKFRPAIASMPRQLTTDFNGNIFIGYRVDRFRISYTETPVGWRQNNKHRALSMGAFGGLGSTAITPWTTNNQIADEYSGFILSRGLAAMIGINNLTVGIGIGWDYLTDRDKGVWIYQNKPWYGLTVGLNLN
jgi:hypothetical protein